MAHCKVVPPRHSVRFCLFSRTRHFRCSADISIASCHVWAGMDPGPAQSCQTRQRPLPQLPDVCRRTCRTHDPSDKGSPRLRRSRSAADLSGADSRNAGAARWFGLHAILVRCARTTCLCREPSARTPSFGLPRSTPSIGMCQSGDPRYCVMRPESRIGATWSGLPTRSRPEL